MKRIADIVVMIFALLLTTTSTAFCSSGADYIKTEDGFFLLVPKMDAGKNQGRVNLQWRQERKGGRIVQLVDAASSLVDNIRDWTQKGLGISVGFSLPSLRDVVFHEEGRKRYERPELSFGIDTKRFLPTGSQGSASYSDGRIEVEVWKAH